MGMDTMMMRGTWATRRWLRRHEPELYGMLQYAWRLLNPTYDQMDGIRLARQDAASRITRLTDTMNADQGAYHERARRRMLQATRMAESACQALTLNR